MTKARLSIKRSPREALFYAMPLFLALVVLSGVVYPRYRAWRLEKDLLAQKKLELVHYEKRLEKLRAELKKPKIRPEQLANRVFSGPDPYVLVAGLREKMEKVPGVSIRSFRIVKREKIGQELERVEVSFVLQTDVKGLAEILWQLEQEPRAIRIKRVSVFVRRGRRGETLSATLNLEGLFWLKKA